MDWPKELINLLPMKWSRWIAGSSILLAVAMYNLPSLLPEQVLAMQPLTLFLVKLLLLTTTLLIGSLLVIILVVRAHNAKDISVNVKITGLDDEEKS